MKVAVITGDVVNSRETDVDVWLKLLKAALQKYGETPKQWEIYRGDSFQLEIREAEQALKAAIYIKSYMKQLPNVDVRMSIGIGPVYNNADRILESNGTAYILSGEAFEKIGKKRLVINTSNREIDEDLNLMIELGSTIMDNWNELSAIVIKESLDHPQANQDRLVTYVKNNEQTRELMKRDKRVSLKNQSNISLILSRSHFELIYKVIGAFENKIRAL